MCSECEALYIAVFLLLAASDGNLGKGWKRG